MMLEKDDLGLSLSLNFPKNQIDLKSTVTPSSSSFDLLKRSSWNESFNSSVPNSETRTVFRGIDVNRPPSTTEYGDEDAGVSSPNSTVSSSTGKRSEREEDTDPQGSRGIISDEEDGDNSRKKLRLSKDQSAILEETFKDHSTLNPKQKQALAKQLGLRARQVEVWFQNRRARTKLKQTEVDCELLRRCCENLTEENRRLQKEVTELRALKLSPQFYMHMSPPTTLTMCPSCEHVTVPVPPTQTQAATSANHRSLPVNAWPRISHGGLTFEALRPRS
ncbi:hypothetical protein AALP_AAs66747U001700 [Arabis alpina]|uniref:Homeobox domain-containing protein n=1 Tax=Arabis alpina TaxID=50452 RepID=A0A087FXB1_ARAAL|nr:hypothetical protein AALP_AAs66747U001700 [Arabis alpina]